MGVTNEFHVEYFAQPGMPLLYNIMVGKQVIGQLASYPTVEDMQTALAKFRGAIATQEPAKARPWIGDDDGPAAA